MTMRPHRTAARAGTPAALLFLVAACARPVVAPVADRSASWVRQTLATMSLEEKVGQMILARSDGAFRNVDDPAERALERAVAEGRLGGVVVFRGTPLATAALANRLQDQARVPVLVASDYEWGAAFRVDGATRFPSAMAIGAGGREEDARAAAEVTALEARALGVHLVLAPVVDLNVHAESAVINTRSFGADPETVGRLAAAFVERVQRAGVLATAKHFPGHGATAADSHRELPVLRVDRRRLETVELVPFRRVIEAGVAAVMPGHLAVPALDGRDDRPATLSPEILGGVLRGELGFGGLVVSDALDMEAVRRRWWDGAAAVAAVAAGCDLLLVPPDPLVAWDALVRAVRRGDLSERRIDEAVTRILRAKARLGLDRARRVEPRRVLETVGRPRWAARAQAIAERAITLVDERPGALPLRAETLPRVVLWSYAAEGDRDVAPSVLEDELAARADAVVHLRATPRSLAAALDELEAAAAAGPSAVVLASYARRRGGLGGADAARDLGKALARVRRGPAPPPVLVVALGDPYVLAGLEGAAARIAAYDAAPLAQRAVARALFGEIDLGGRLPVALGAEYPVGHGIERERRRMELTTVEAPEEAGFSSEGIVRAMRILRRAIDDRVFPGAAVVVARRGRVAVARGLGRLSYDPNAPEVTTRTLYDLASLTKVVVTTTLAMILTERGRLDLERPVVEYVPEFGGEGKESVAVADLLAHSGGLLWWKDLYREAEGLSPDEARRFYVETIARMPLAHPPRTKTEYSDLGIILFGEILERATARRLDELARTEIFEPLGLRETFFRPPASLRERIAPTENDPWRGRVLRGEVHDENAFALGGVAPHAGLFSTASDLARFAQMLLNGGIYGDRRIVKPATIRRFTRRANRVEGSSRALGWDTPSGESSAGRYFSASSFGHTGFTGTSIWIDPERELFVVLLTNRVHPSRDDDRIRRVRPAFHDAIVEAIADEPVAPRARGEEEPPP